MCREMSAASRLCTRDEPDAARVDLFVQRWRPSPTDYFDGSTLTRHRPGRKWSPAAIGTNRGIAMTITTARPSTSDAENRLVASLRATVQRRLAELAGGVAVDPLRRRELTQQLVAEV